MSRKQLSGRSGLGLTIVKKKLDVMGADFHSRKRNMGFCFVWICLKSSLVCVMFAVLTIQNGSSMLYKDFVFCVPLCLGGRVAVFIFCTERACVMVDTIRIFGVE